LAAGGTSFDSLYVNVNGESGYFDRSLDVYGRLVKLFESLAETTAEGGRRVPGGWSQRKLAERVGASPSMVNRVLKELAAGEYIGITPQGIELLRPLPRRW